MLKRSIVIFCVSLFLLTGWLSFQRQKAEAPPQFLTLTVGNIDFNLLDKSGSYIVTTSPNGKSVQVLYEDLPLVLNAATWSADGKWLYYSTVNDVWADEPEFLLQRVRVGEQTPEFLGNGYIAKFAPHTAQFAYVNKDEHLVIEQKESPILFDNYSVQSEFAWTPDGEWII